MINTINASLTAEPLLHKEFKVLIEFVKENKLSTKEEIYKKVVTVNLFHYKSPKSTLRRLNPLYKRYACLSKELLNDILTSSLQDSLVVTLFSIYKTNKLFETIFNDVLKSKFESLDLSLHEKDIFSHLFKLETEYPEGLKWKDYTRKKIVQVVLRILFEANILTKAGILQRCTISGKTTEHIIKNGGKNFIEIIQLL